MKLHRLHVKNFAAVREVDIEFGPGLNVLYGPNDLGKSTLGEAIRLALLLPHSSTSCEPYVEWAGGHDPIVELTFETEPQRIWRVRKEFGKTGSSLLQESRNGQDFDDVERARKVDGKLREILRWGIPEPGGSGGGKGIPSSFLATALLSTQADVTAMLRDSLESDPNASGKERIAAALQAVAQDPMFVALLRNVQARRDEAYTDKGMKKTAKGSVFKVAAERVTEAREEKERLQRVVADSEGAEKLLQTLYQKRVQKQEALAVAEERVILVERLAQQAGDRATAAEQVRLAQEEVYRIRKIGLDVEEAAKKSSDLLVVVDEAKQNLIAAENAKTVADTAFKSAEEAARTKDAATDTVVRQQLELRIATAEHAGRTAQQRIDAATDAQALINAAVEAEREHQAQQSRASTAQETAAQAAAQEQVAVGDLHRCDLLEQALDVRSADRSATDARIAVDKHSSLRTRRAAVLEERAALAERRAALTVPVPTALVSMRRLAQELAAARGALDVGFIVTVNPKRSVNIAIRKDGASTDSISAKKPLEIEASTEVELTIEDLASVFIRGGRRETQEKVLELEKRWKREVAPHLASSGAADLAALEAKVVEAQDLDAAIKAKDTESESLRTQMDPLAGAADTLRQALERLENCRVALGGVAMEPLSADLDKLGADPGGGLRKLRQQLSKATDSARSTASEAVTASTLAEERVSNLAALLAAAIAKRDLALSSFPDGVASALASGRSDLASATAEEQNDRAELASLDQTMASQKARVEEAVSGARRLCEKAKTALDAAQVRLGESMTTHAAQVGQLTALTKLRDAEDFGGAEAGLREATGRYEALPIPERAVTKEEVSGARTTEASLKSELDEIERDIHRAHGALEQVGGAVARERLRDATEALDLAQQQEREDEANYEAWKLLLDQLKEADAAQASNLGQVIAPAIASGFQALTDQRYEAVRLTATLGTEGVVVAGAIRQSDRMSVGTREQLSTLYRLSLAEYLQSVLVLDDQLVQSDESRMDWFRALLKEKSRSFQIVVFTCRPRDYLERGGMVPKGKALFSDSDNGFIRAIDLGRAFCQVNVER